MDSSSDAIVQQKKGNDEVVKWNEYEALRDSLDSKIEKIVEDRSEERRVGKECRL